MTTWRVIHTIWAVIRATPRFIVRLPVNLLWRWPKAAVCGVWRGLCAFVRGIRRAARWSWSLTRYYAALFWHTSRRFLRLEGYLALSAMIIWFGLQFSQPSMKGGHEILGMYYEIFTITMILLGMNLLPRERDEDTLEILWSQPFSRGGLVLVQAFTLIIWCAFVMGVLGLLFGRYLSSNSYGFWVALHSLTTAFAVLLITVLVSTFCRNAISTGIVAALIFGIHYFWFKNLGPINLYYNPIPPAQRATMSPDVPLVSAIVNRVFVLVLLGFVYDYLLRRLRHSSPWFT